MNWFCKLQNPIAYHMLHRVRTVNKHNALHCKMMLYVGKLARSPHSFE